jgi:hypothetical protein
MMEEKIINGHRFVREDGFWKGVAEVCDQCGLLFDPPKKSAEIDPGFWLCSDCKTKNLARSAAETKARLAREREDQATFEAWERFSGAV